jgi:hypothetical protein
MIEIIFEKIETMILVDVHPSSPTHHIFPSQPSKYSRAVSI